MAEDNKNPNEGRKNGEFKVPPRTYILWIAILGAIPLLMVFKNSGPSQVDRLNQIQFMQLVESNLVTKGVIIYDPQSQWIHEVQGEYKKSDGDKETRPFAARVRLTDKLEDKLMDAKVFETRQPNTVLLGLIYSLGPILLIGVLIWFFFIRQIKMAGKGALSFGKSKARMLTKGKNKTSTPMSRMGPRL